MRFKIERGRVGFREKLERKETEDSNMNFSTGLILNGNNGKREYDNM